MPHPYPYPWNRLKDPLSIPAGMLRSEIEIQQPAAAPGALGASVSPVSWTKVLAAMAAIDNISSRDTYNAEQLTGQVSHVIWIRWTDTPIVAGYRVKYQATPTAAPRYFLLQAAPENVQERNRVLTLRCLEVDGTQ